MVLACLNWIRGAALVTITVALTHCVHAQGDQAPRADQSQNKWRTTRNLGRSVNSVYEDLNPVLTADGNTLYFARKHTPTNTGGRRDPQDVYLAEMVNGSWSASRNAGPPLNTPDADNVCAISSDSKRLYYFIRRTASSGYFGYRERNLSGWSDIKETGLEVTNRSDYLESCLAQDEQTILFTANTRDNIFAGRDHDERDIYVAMRKYDGTWTRPVNLGQAVNSTGDEYSPFLAADGRTLYFATNGRGGYGGVDLFVTRRIGDGWTAWTTPVNLGPEINSPGFDGYLTVAASGKRALYVTRNRSLGGTDIMAAALPRHLSPLPVVLVRGAVLDEQTHSEVAASIAVNHLGGMSRYINATTYAVTAEPGMTMQFTIEAKGYETKVETIGISDVVDVTVLEQNITLRRAASKTFASEPIHFDAGKAVIRSESFATLDSIIMFLQGNPGIKLAIMGHTDNRGSDRRLRELSRDRAREVKAYLLANGVAGRRLRSRGAGSTQPIAKNDNETNRSRNRRVEFHFLN